jgi:hypothetical protein
VANKWLRVAPRAHNIEQAVEWLYCFDVHCNSYFPLFLVLYPLQFFLVPLLLKPVFLATLLANSIYCGAYCYYWYITFLGYQVLPFLDTPKTVVFLYPCVVVLASYILLLVTRNNLTIVILTQYFGTEDPTMA